MSIFIDMDHRSGFSLKLNFSNPIFSSDTTIIFIFFIINFPLPGRDDQGRKVIYINTGGYDPKETSLADVLKVGFMGTDVLLMEEETQVGGGSRI